MPNTPTLPTTESAASFPFTVSVVLGHYHDNLVQYLAPMEAFSKTLPARFRKRWIAAISCLNDATVGIVIAAEEVEDVAKGLRDVTTATTARRKATA